MEGSIAHQSLHIQFPLSNPFHISIIINIGSEQKSLDDVGSTVLTSAAEPREVALNTGF